jgi:exopolyphosphatase/guanosine-5'-triphosphate,3'-diphosphate pyrophosphatase
MRLAAIDVGTNTIRLLIGEADGLGGYRPVLGAQEITRLGQGLLPEKILQPEPMRRSLAVLARFRALAEGHGATEIAAVGTSALREAGNRDAFLAQARAEAGLDVAVIPGAEEARLTLLGVRAGLPDPPRHLVMLDIGGGSTELLLADGPIIRGMVSTGLGAVKLSEECFPADPPDAEALAAARKIALTRLLRVRAGELPPWDDGAALVGTAGTVTTLAAIDLRLDPYDPERVNGHRLRRDRVAALLQDLAALPLPRRRQVRGLEPARADIIVGGTIICLAVMDALGFSHLLVSDGGLREGILLDLLDRVRARPSGPASRAPGNS